MNALLLHTHIPRVYAHKTIPEENQHRSNKMNSKLSKLDAAFLHNNEMMSDCDLKLITSDIDGESRRLRKEDSCAEV